MAEPRRSFFFVVYKGAQKMGTGAHSNYCLVVKKKGAQNRIFHLKNAPSFKAKYSAMQFIMIMMKFDMLKSVRFDQFFINIFTMAEENFEFR